VSIDNVQGNDDQAFWGCSVLSALEARFPNPPSSIPGWKQLAENLFNDQISRWNTTRCNGGLKWQIYPQNSYGYDYKNAISNGGLFQIAARLARYTGNSTYVDWANKVWDWEWQIGLIDNGNYNVYDGTDDTKNCGEVNHLQWTYNVAMHLYGAAVMYNCTGRQVWRNRTQGLLNAAQVFFSPYDNSTNVMYEAACETIQTCDADQFSFKGYLGRWLAKTTQVAPFTTAQIMPLLQASAQAAAQSCSGGDDGVTCGTKWYVNGWDGTWGAGQQMSALEVIQSLLVAKAGPPDSLVGQGVPESQAADGTTSASLVPKSTTFGTAPSPTSSPSAVTSSSGTRRLRVFR
jgi:mannan endo-1,6-alpha-mannosidase